MGVLTDPVANKVVGPPVITNFMGPARFIDIPCDSTFQTLLSVVDIVLISHSHYDHLDIDMAKIIGNSKLWIVPLGLKAILERVGITNCVELNWWDSYKTTVTCSHVPVGDVGSSSSSSNGSSDKIVHSGSFDHTMNTKRETKTQEIEVTLTPAKHWSARTFFDRNKSLWGSFVISSEGQKFFFSGDTAYCSVFKQIGEKHGPFDLAAIPIGAYKPRWFMKDVHCDPTEAVMIHKDLRSRRSMAIHWGTYPLAEEDPIEPALELARARESQDVSTIEFFTMKHGETCDVGDDVEKNKIMTTDFATVQHPELYEQFLLLNHKEEISDTKVIKSTNNGLHRSCTAVSSSSAPIQPRPE